LGQDGAHCLLAGFAGFASFAGWLVLLVVLVGWLAVLVWHANMKAPSRAGANSFDNNRLIAMNCKQFAYWRWSCLQVV
jgi:hypothetical protein